MAGIILTRGLPASGKTTWARDMVAKNPETHVNVNKDDIRTMLFNYVFSGKNEKLTTKVRDFIIYEALRLGKTVIVSDTNLNPKQVRRLTQIGEECGATVTIKEFPITLEEAIRRDEVRKNKPGERSVGPQVIKDMYNQWILQSK